MPATLTVPRLGVGSPGGLIAEWYMPDGARVKPGDRVFRMESGHVSLDIEAESQGTVRHVIPAGIPQFEGGVVGYVLAPGERMPAAEDDGWDEGVTGEPEESDGTDDGDGFGGAGHVATEPVPLRPTPAPAEYQEPRRQDPATATGVPMGATTQAASLAMAVSVPMPEEERLRNELAGEWSDVDARIGAEAIIVRAMGYALKERPALAEYGMAIDVVRLAAGGPEHRVATTPAEGGFHTVVRSMQMLHDAPSVHPVSLVSFTAFGIDSAQPGLVPGRVMAVALTHPVVTSAATLTLVYDPVRVQQHDAAAFLGRVRELLVQPYALLA